SRTALLLINAQRDSLLPCDDFIEHHAPDPNTVESEIERARMLLEACRVSGLSIFHTTRRGHSYDTLVSSTTKARRQADIPGSERVPQVEDGGSIELPAERGHECSLIDEMQPIPGEIIIEN